jgi:hypothetical protein
MYDNHHHNHHHGRDVSGYSRNNYHHHHHYNHNQIPFNHLQQQQQPPHSDQYGMSHQSYPVLQSSLPYQSNSYSSSSHKKHRNRSSCNYIFLIFENI